MFPESSKNEGNLLSFPGKKSLEERAEDVKGGNW